MNDNLPAEKPKLPTIQELYSGDLESKVKQNDLNMLLNQPPHQTWLKEHPMTKGVTYLPIQRVEWLLTKIFIEWWVEIRQVQVIANSVTVTVRLFYRDVISNEAKWQDGLGAAPIQTDKGSGAMDWNATKNNAVMKAAPAAESYAVKDAAEKIGKIFGKDMNRADQIVYNDLSRVSAEPPTLKRND